MLRLSKSKFMAGTQCHKRLWLECNQPDLLDEIGNTAQYRIETGNKVGEVAHQRYPDGVLVGVSHSFSNSVYKTNKLLADPAVPAVYEGAFEYDGIRILIDVLHRTQDDDSWDVIEVKSSASVKQHHQHDLAVQLYVLRGCGLNVRQTHLMHINSNYVFSGGEYILEELFTVADLTDIAIGMQEEVSDAVTDMKTMLAETHEPDIEVGSHCSTPYTCPFYSHCNDVCMVENPISELPRARRPLRESLAQSGIESIVDIPENFAGLSDIQTRVRDVVVSGKPYFDSQLKNELNSAVYPIHFLDFETFAPVLPLYAGTSPYKAIPFQWSNHIMDEDGSLTHYEFLHDGEGDPRTAFADTLLTVLGDSGSIVVYSSYEKTTIRKTAIALPDKADALHALIDRLFDLLPLVRRNVYHPDFHGSFSIKKVLSALVSGASYDDLDIADGTSASIAYEGVIATDPTLEHWADTRKNLLAYCKRDTEAMVWLFKRLSSQ